ncbi:MAG: class D sortase [Acidobacteriota bacterium]
MRSRRTASLLLVLSGLFLLGVSGRHYVRGWLAQREARRTFESGRPGTPAPVNPAFARVSDRLAFDVGDRGEIPTAPGGVPEGYPYGEPVARLRIPSARIDAIVFGGADQATLEKGPGHVPGTELPGADSPFHNCVITGHRDSHFRRLGWLQKGHEIDLESPPGTRRRYRVVSREIVTPSDVRVIQPTETPRLTLITCYPFNYVGPAPKRLVIVAIPVAS